MRDQQAALEQVKAEGTAPLVLVGPPTDLQGELCVCNHGEARVIVRDLRLLGSPAPEARKKKTGKGSRAKASGGKASPLLEQSLRRVVLRPGQARRVPLQIALERGTPPGEYSAEIQVAAKRYPATLHVTEVVDLEISPDSLVIEGAPGSKVTKQVVMTNAGNVALEIGNVGAVPLDEELVHCRTQRAALAEVGDSIESLDDYVAALGRHYKAAFDSAAKLRIRNRAVKLAPSETKRVSFTIQIPSEVLRRTRYFASVPFYSSTLDVTVVSS